jgi:hypothetical protein
MDQPTLSPDGRWRWNGQAWVPNEAAPPGPTPSPGKKRHWPWYVAVASVVIFGGVCIAASQGRQQSGSPGTRAATSSTAPAVAATAPPTQAPARDGSCSPQPCANDSYGWIVTVGAVKYDAPSGNELQKPEAGNVYVNVAVTFTNKLAQERSASPFNFVLLDGAGIKHKVTFTLPCPTWDPVNLTRGAALGPKCLAFEAAADRPAGLVLVWTPQLLGGGDYKIKLS